MSLFKQFSGPVKDVEGNLIETFRVKGYHNTTGVWSSWYTNDVPGQYNLNMGDAAWLSQSGKVNIDDIVLLVFETLEDDPIDRKFCLLEMPITDTDVYLQPVQLKGCMEPNVYGLWSLHSPTDNLTKITDKSYPTRTIYLGRCNETIDVIQSFTDEHKWAYNGRYMRHAISYLGQDIFSDRLGVKTTLYNWNTDVFEDNNNHIFTVSSKTTSLGYFPVIVRCKNKAGIVAEDTIFIQIKYNKPSLDFTFSNDKPSINDKLDITSTITDNDKVITNINYFFDNTPVGSNKLPIYSWTQELGIKYIANRGVRANVSWTDGFTANEFVVEETINMSNLHATFTVNKTVSSIFSNIRLEVLNLSDPDGETAKVRLKWLIEMLAPLSGTYNKIFSTEYPSIPEDHYIDIPLVTAGNYKVTATSIDEYGAEYSASTEFLIEDSTTTNGCSQNSVEWE